MNLTTAQLSGPRWNARCPTGAYVRKSWRRTPGACTGAIRIRGGVYEFEYRYRRLLRTLPPRMRIAPVHAPGVLRQLFLTYAPVGHRAFQRGPESWAVVRFMQVNHLVTDHIVRETHGQLKQPPVETDDAIARARSPAEPEVTNFDARR